MKHAILLAALGALAAGCGGDDAPPDVECPTTGRYLPLEPGTSWTYQVDDGELAEKTQTVGALEDIGGDKAGTMAYRLETLKPGGAVVSWQEDTGDGVIRHRELDMAGSTMTDEIYEPFRTRVSERPEHLEVGAVWTETYTEVITDDVGTTMVEKSERWEVESIDEAISVPAGDFCTLRVRRTSSVVGGTAGSDKTYWFARGVGKIRETGDSQTEELVDF